MKPFKNYESTQTFSSRPTLPAGGYVCKIMNAEEKVYKSSKGKNDTFSKLEISFDIIEGEYSGFFASDYRSQQNEDKKWKGVLRMSVPSDDGTEMDEKIKSMFKTNITAIEESNSGYHWDWNEKALKGLVVGCLFQSQEWEWEGKSGWKSQPYGFIDAEKIRSGDFKVPKPKPLKNGGKSVPAQASSAMSDFTEVSDSDLPF